MDKNLLIRLLLIFSLFLPFATARADIIQIDLRDFYADPTVTVASDGSSATMIDDQNLITVLLSNDPLFGEPGIPVPLGLLNLSFFYSFTEGATSDDNFYAKVFDGDTGTILKDFSLDNSGSGLINWNLSGIGSEITLLGLEFQLNANPNDNDTAFDSTVAIRNPQMETGAAPIPEPGTLILLGSGLAGLLGLGRKKLLHRS